MRRRRRRRYIKAVYLGLGKNIEKKKKEKYVRKAVGEENMKRRRLIN